MTKATSRMRGPERAYAKDEETDVEVGSTVDERNTKHALRPAEGQDTTMHPEEPQRVTDDCDRMTPLRGKYEREVGRKSTVRERKAATDAEIESQTGPYILNADFHSSFSKGR